MRRSNACGNWRFPDVSPETKGGCPFPHCEPRALSISRESPSISQLRVDSRIAGGRGIAYGNSRAASGGSRSCVRGSNQIPTITNPQSGLVYLLGAKTGSFYSRTGRPLALARAHPPPPRRPVAIHAAVNPNCIIKI